MKSPSISSEEYFGSAKLKHKFIWPRRTEQLARVEARLAQPRGGDHGDHDVIVKRLDALRVVALSEDLTTHSQIGGSAGRLYPRLQRSPFEWRRLRCLSFAFYEDTDDEHRPFRMTVALPVRRRHHHEDGVTTLDMPAVDRAATTVVRGAPTSSTKHSPRSTNGPSRTASS